MDELAPGAIRDRANADLLATRRHLKWGRGSTVKTVEPKSPVHTSSRRLDEPQEVPRVLRLWPRKAHRLGKSARLFEAAGARELRKNAREDTSFAAGGLVNRNLTAPSAGPISSPSFPFVRLWLKSVSSTGTLLLRYAAPTALQQSAFELVRTNGRGLAGVSWSQAGPTMPLSHFTAGPVRVALAETRRALQCEGRTPRGRVSPGSRLRRGSAAIPPVSPGP